LPANENCFVKRIFLILTAFVMPALCASAMGRLDALSQIETGNNDYAIGTRQEVSRYQILPEFWQEANVAWHPTDPASAKIVVKWIMQGRCQSFESRYHRSPTDFEYYILWHRPASLVGRSVSRPLTLGEIDRARRFANLCQSGE
jgi:hypothetical protein